MQANQKLFVGGLAPSVTQCALLRYFSKFGPVAKATVILDKNSGRSRCFGFVSMQGLHSTSSALAAKHSLHGKTLECRTATPKDKVPPNRAHRKVFVGGLAPEVTCAEFQAYFARFGIVVDAVVMKDKATGRPRGFGFVTFVDERSVDCVLSEFSSHFIRGKWAECKRATPKEEMEAVSGHVSTDVSRQSLGQVEEESAELCYSLLEAVLKE